MDRSAERLFINVLRGIAVFLMLWGHCVQYCYIGEFDFFEDLAYRWIYSFHMPLFMLVSGYLFFFSLEKRDFKTLIIHRTQALLQPIVMIQILAFFLTTGIKACLSGSFQQLFDGSWANSLGSPLLWFLWSVLVCSLVAAVAFRAVQNTVLRCFVLLFGIVFAALFPNAELNLFMYPYFMAGLLWAKWRPRVPKVIQYFKYISVVLYPILFLLFRKEHFIYTSGLFDPGNMKRQIMVDLFRWVIGLVGSVFVITLLEGVFALLRISDTDKWKGVRRTFGKLGEKSLQVYTLSVIFLSMYLPHIIRFVVNRAGYNFMTQNIWLYDFVYMPLLAALYAAALLGICRLLEKMKISKVLFGR